MNETFIKYIKGVEEYRTRKFKLNKMGKSSYIFFPLLNIGTSQCGHDMLHCFYKEATKKLQTGEIFLIGNEGGMDGFSDEDVQPVLSRISKALPKMVSRPVATKGNPKLRILSSGWKGGRLSGESADEVCSNAHRR